MSSRTVASRGEIWRYDPVIRRPGRSDLRLVVSANAVNRDPGLPVLWSVHLVPEPGESLLSVWVEPFGYAAAATLEPTVGGRLTDQLGVADPSAMEQVDVALRALLEL